MWGLQATSWCRLAYPRVPATHDLGHESCWGDISQPSTAIGPSGEAYQREFRALGPANPVSLRVYMHSNLQRDHSCNLAAVPTRQQQSTLETLSCINARPIPFTLRRVFKAIPVQKNPQTAVLENLMKYVVNGVTCAARPSRLAGLHPNAFSPSPLLLSAVREGCRSTSRGPAPS